MFSQESGKLVTGMGKESWDSYVHPSPACHWFSRPAFPLAGTCQGFLRTCLSVYRLGNHAMTSLASTVASFPGPLPTPWHCEQLLSCLPVALPRLSLFPVQICSWWEAQVGKDHFKCNKDHCRCSQNTWVNAANSLHDLG